MRTKKRYHSPFKKREKYPYNCFIKIVWHLQYITLFGVCKVENKFFPIEQKIGSATVG
jgi:hypothetical protein